MAFDFSIRFAFSAFRNRFTYTRRLTTGLIQYAKLFYCHYSCPTVLPPLSPCTLLSFLLFRQFSLSYKQNVPIQKNETSCRSSTIWVHSLPLCGTLPRKIKIAAQFWHNREQISVKRVNEMQILHSSLSPNWILTLQRNLAASMGGRASGRLWNISGRVSSAIDAM